MFQIKMSSRLSTIALCPCNSTSLCGFCEKDWISEDDHDRADCKDEKIHMATSLGFALLSETYFPSPTSYRHRSL